MVKMGSKKFGRGGGQNWLIVLLNFCRPTLSICRPVFNPQTGSWPTHKLV